MARARLVGRVPSPLAHIGSALALRHLSRPGVWPIDRVGIAAALASIAPDVDMVLVVLLPGGLAWHHGPTHSVVGATFLAGAVAVAMRVRKPSSVAIVLLSGVFHVLLDGLTGNPAEAAQFGVPWAWPFSNDRWISSHAIFVPFGIDREGFLWHMISGAGRAYGVEAAFVAACFGVVLAARSLVSGGSEARTTDGS